MSDIVIENIGGEIDEPIGSVSVDIFIAPHNDFTDILEPGAFNAADIADVATIAGPHTFPAEKGFTKMKMVVESGNINCNMIGERKRKLFQNDITGKISGSAAKVLGFMRRVKNGGFIVLVEEAGTGQMRQLGSKQFPAEFTALTHLIEPAVEGDNSLTFTIQDKQKWPAPIYTGTVTEKPA